MIQKIKSLLLVLTASTMLGGVTLAPAMILSTGSAAAACNSQQNSLNAGVTAATGTNTSGVDPCGSSANTDSTISHIATDVVNIFSIIVGAASVFMIIYGGFRYITSGGDSGRVSSAKNTLIYAIIGLIIVALAQFIVHFVINTAINQTS